MADYRRYLGDRLRYHFELRLPTRAQLAEGLQSGSFVEEVYLRDHLIDLVARARRPDLLAACLDSSRDEVIPDDDHARDVKFARLFIAVEQDRDEMARHVSSLESRIAQLTKERDKAVARASMPASARIRRRARRAVTGVTNRLPRRAT